VPVVMPSDAEGVHARNQLEKAREVLPEPPAQCANRETG
jgi:hypothetical protein